MEVDSETIAGCGAVGKKSGLKDCYAELGRAQKVNSSLTRICTDIPARDDGSRREGHLFNLAKLIHNIFIQRDLSESPQGGGTCRPSSGRVEYVDWKRVHVGWLHDLGVHVPCRIGIAGNAIMDISRKGVRVLASEFFGFLSREVFNALVGENMDPDIDEGLMYHSCQQVINTS